MAENTKILDTQNDTTQSKIMAVIALLIHEINYNVSMKQWIGNGDKVIFVIVEYESIAVIVFIV